MFLFAVFIAIFAQSSLATPTQNAATSTSNTESPTPYVELAVERDQEDDVHNPYGFLPYQPSGIIPGANEDDSGGHPSPIVLRIIEDALSIVEMTDEEREEYFADEAHQE
jgi:hypothetical protein